MTVLALNGDHEIARSPRLAVFAEGVRWTVRTSQTPLSDEAAIDEINRRLAATRSERVERARLNTIALTGKPTLP